MRKDKDILIRIDEKTKEDAKLKAKSIGLSLSSWIRTLIVKELKE
jgi:antitoxin component of RelBE/YafQ-DinJ toxin-antitoxin module